MTTVMECRHGLERFFLQYHKQLVLSVLRILGSMEEAQDVAQEAYVLVLTRGGKRSSDHLRYLLFRTAKNRALDRIRRRKRHAAYLRMELPAVDLDDAEGAYLMRQALDRLDSVLEELPTKQRHALVWWRLDNLSQMSIARRLAVSQASVTRYVSRAAQYCALRLEGLSQQVAARAAR